jgi:hypothetical protein
VGYSIFRKSLTFSLYAIAGAKRQVPEEFETSVQEEMSPVECCDAISDCGLFVLTCEDDAIA